MGIEDITFLHMVDCGGQPECHEILPLLLEGRALSLIFFNLIHDLDKPYQVVFRQEEGPSPVQYESEFTSEEVLHRILCSISSLQSGPQKQKPAALLVGTYLDQTNKEHVLTLDESVQEAFKSYIKKDILCPASVQGGRKRYIIPLDNMSKSQEDIENLRKVIFDTIIKRFPAEDIPTAWLLLHLLLRARYEHNRGWCSLEECIATAKACGISREELLGEHGVLRFIHKYYGTILYYINVPGLRDKVLCDPNIILLPLTRLFIFSFACIQGQIETAELIRRTGEIPHEVMESVCASNSEDPVPTSDIVALLKDRYILYEGARSAVGTKSYFMPCLLKPDHSVKKDAQDPTTLVDLNPAPLQLVPQSTGYVPLGLFPALVVKLSHTWVLDSEERFRNRIRFFVPDGTRKLELRQHSNYIELRLLPLGLSMASHCEVSDAGTLIFSRQELWQALVEVSDRYSHTKDVTWQLGFYCPGGLKAGASPHPAVCFKIPPQCVVCSHKSCYEDSSFPLEDKHEIWFKVRSRSLSHELYSSLTITALQLTTAVFTGSFAKLLLSYDIRTSLPNETPALLFILV